MTVKFIVSREYIELLVPTYNILVRNLKVKHINYQIMYVRHNLLLYFT